MTTGRINQVAFLEFPRGRPRPEPDRPRRSSEATERPADAKGPEHRCPTTPPAAAPARRPSIRSSHRSPNVPHPKHRAIAARPVPVRPLSAATGRSARRALGSAPRRLGSANADGDVRSQPVPSRPVRSTANPSPRAQAPKRRLTATKMKPLGTTRFAARAGIPRSQTSPTPLMRR